MSSPSRPPLPSPSRSREEPALRSLLAHARPHWRAVAAGTLLGLLGGAAGLAQPLVAKAVIDALTGGRPVTGPILALTGMIVVSVLIMAVGRYILERTGESVVLTARGRMIERLLRLRLAALDRTKPGDLMSRATSDVALLRSATTQGLVSGVTGTCTMIGAIVMMALTDAVLLAATLGVLGVTILPGKAVMPRIARANRRAQAAIGEMGAVLERGLGALRTVKASGAEEREIAAAKAAGREAWRHSLSAACWQGAAGVTSTLAVQVAFLVVLGLGGARVASGALTLSSLIAFLLYVIFLAAPISQVVGATGALQGGLAATRRINEVERLPVEHAQSSVSSGGEPLSVRFSSVTFGYLADRPPVLRGVSLEVPPTGMTAVVGPSGSGKSTMFALMERFYDVEDGSVAVGGRDVRQWPLADLRAAIGYVEQDAPVMTGTLRDNIRYSLPAATDDDIRDVLARARLTMLLDQLPEGLDTWIGHRGTTLSGGQRQRVAIARALLRRPRLLLLDEITSQLDAASELALRDAVESIARTTTVMVIAHRLSTVMNAAQIVVVESGRVRATGTHAELVDTDRLYRELASGQFLSPALR